MRCTWIAVQVVDGATINPGTGLPPVPGDMYEVPFDLVREGISPKYLALSEPRRLPIVIILPTGRWFCIDSRAYDHERGGWHGDGWTVLGRPPHLTLHPSIDAKGTSDAWHGFLKRGELVSA